MTAIDVAFPTSSHLHRPRPAVIQAPPSTLRCTLTGRPSVKSSSTSSDSSMPVTPPSSNPHSGESWFQISAADYPSHSYVPPLPKGARPPSPQPFILASALAPQARSRNKRRGAPPLHRHSSSWKLEWRGLSKIVKWAFLGDRHEEPVKPRERGRSNERTHDQRGPRSLPAHHRHYHRERVQQTVTQAPLSPSTSATCVDNGVPFLSKSELGHDSEAGHKSASRYHGVYPSAHMNASLHDLEQREQTNYLTPRYGSYAYLSPESNSHNDASTDYGHQDGMVTMHAGTDNVHVDVDDSVISHDSNFHWRSSARDVQSDLGHGGYRPGFVSSTSLNNAQRIMQGEAASRRPFLSFRSAKSNISLLTPLDNVESQRPRRLRKKSCPQRPPLPRIYTNDRLREAPPSSLSPVSRTSFSTSPSMTVPLSSTKSVTRRKLVKRRSSINASSLLATSDIPPDVPPKDSLFISKATIETSDTLQSVNISSSNTDNTGPSDVLPHKRPSILRTESNRRWTVAVADVPDDFFVEELERLRKIGRLRAVDMHGVRKVRTEQVHTIEVDSNGNMETGIEMIEKTEKEERHSLVIQNWSPEEESEWLHARRAIMCCRELVRTERSYRARLQDLYNGNISDTVPDLLLQYIPALIYASNYLSAQFNEDMSASGVSEAFLKAESLLVPAFIAWSSVIGTFFGFESTLMTSRNHKRKLTGSSMVTEDKQFVTPSGTVRLRRFSARSRHESFTSYPSTPVKASSPIGPSASTMGHPQTSSRQSSMTSDERESSASGKKHIRKRETRLQDRRRFPPFRDFAILPTQRVTRYVLLYKDLLKHTQTSSQARLVVEKAVGAAISLAQKCDGVQDKAHMVPP